MQVFLLCAECAAFTLHVNRPNLGALVQLLATLSCSGRKLVQASYSTVYTHALGVPLVSAASVAVCNRGMNPVCKPGCTIIHSAFMRQVIDAFVFGKAAISMHCMSQLMRPARNGPTAAGRVAWPRGRREC
jgi:hypothetical protein